MNIWRLVVSEITASKLVAQISQKRRNPPLFKGGGSPSFAHFLALHRALRRMAGLGSLLVFWVLAGACQRHGVDGFLSKYTTSNSSAHFCVREREMLLFWTPKPPSPEHVLVDVPPPRREPTPPPGLCAILFERGWRCKQKQTREE